MGFYLGLTVFAILIGVGTFVAVLTFNKSSNKKEKISKEEKE